MIINFEDKFLLTNFNKIGKSFIERYWKKFQIEQIAYRMYLCKNCLENRKCSMCECNPIDMIIEPFSCNKQQIFPNVMNQLNWEEFKQKHNITVENELHL